MIGVSRMDHLNMGVRSIDETEVFYRDNFGFVEKERGVALNGNPFAIIGLADRVYLCIYEEGDLPIASENLLIHHFGLHVEDIDEALSELRDRGVHVDYGGFVQQGKSRSVYIRDPNGYAIELVEKIGGDLH